MHLFQKPSSTRIGRRALLAGSALAALPFTTRGQAPDADAPLRIVVPFAAGSTIDALARLVAQKLPETSAHKVILVDNRPGAAGILGTSFAAKSRPDGKTIVVQANGLTTTPAVRSDLPYDLQKDLAPLSFVGIAPYAFVAPADAKYASLKELFDWSRSTKQPIAFGTSGPGSQSEFVLAQVAKSANVEFLKVPFKGQGDIMLAVMGGQIQMAMINMPSAVRQYQDRRVKILATLTERRGSATPDVPTLTEAGFADINESAWYGFLSPAGTPTALLDELSRDITTVLIHPEVKSKLTDMGIDVVAGSRAEFGERLNVELARYRRIAKEENIKVE